MSVFGKTDVRTPGGGGARVAPCHEAGDQATNDLARKAPATPQKHCPFCQGFAAFQFAIAPPIRSASSGSRSRLRLRTQRARGLQA
jgi:hypothetical protein